MAFPKTSNVPFAAQDNRSIPPLAENGQQYVVGAARGGIGMQLFTVTPAGASLAVTFAGAGAENMADANYRLFYGGETATTRPYTDVSTKTAAGFTILGCTAAEDVEVLVVGRIAGTRADGRDL